MSTTPARRKEAVPRNPPPTESGETGAAADDQRDETATCIDCGEPFTFRQHRVVDAWWPHLARRCDECVSEERIAQEQQEEAERLERSREERERRERRIQSLLEQAGASPWEHGHCTLQNFDARESGPDPIQAAHAFVSAVVDADKYDPVPGLYLAGPTGGGKTHLATAIARKLMLNPHIAPDSIVFDPADVLVSRIRSLYGGKGDVDAFLRKRETARVWILDDLGREPPHPDVVGHLTMLISQRSLRGTVITGNLAPEEYEGRHPDLARIGSRLGPAYFRTVKVNGRDRRFDE